MWLCATGCVETPSKLCARRLKIGPSFLFGKYVSTVGIIQTCLEQSVEPPQFFFASICKHVKSSLNDIVRIPITSCLQLLLQ